jgi:four helix bundle protein
MPPDSVRNLEIWREGTQAVKDVYCLTREWPKEEIYGLTAQVRRAAVSIPANLAEGVGRGAPKEAARFAQISLGSLYELDTLLYLAAEIGFGEAEAIEHLQQRLSSLSRRISSYIRYQVRTR